jgi:hypothetical protein
MGTTTTSATTMTLPSDREILIERGLVFEALTRPERRDTRL